MTRFRRATTKRKEEVCTGLEAEGTQRGPMYKAYGAITEMMGMPVAVGPLLVSVRPSWDMMARRLVAYARCPAFACAVATAALRGPAGPSGIGTR